MYVKRAGYGNGKKNSIAAIKIIFLLFFSCFLIFSCKRDKSKLNQNILEENLNQMENGLVIETPVLTESLNIKDFLMGRWYCTFTFFKEGEGEVIDFAEWSRFSRGYLESDYIIKETLIKGTWRTYDNIVNLNYSDWDDRDIDENLEIEIIDQNTINIKSYGHSTQYTREGEGTKKLLKNENEHLVIRTISTQPDLIPFVTYSHDGKKILSYTDNRRIILWDAESGEQIWTTKKFSHGINSIAFSPDGKEIVSGGLEIAASGSPWSDVRRWDADTGEQIGTIDSLSNEVSSVIYTPDNKYIITASAKSNNRIFFYEKISGYDFDRMDQHTGVSSLALSSDENLFLINYNDGEMHLFSFEKYPRTILVKKFREYSGEVLAIFSPDDNYILSTERYSGNELLASSMKLWDTKSGEEVRTFTGHRSAVNSIAFNHGGSMIVSGSRDRSIKLWAADTGQVIRTYTGHSKGVSSVAFSPDGKHIASSSEDGTIKIWELDTQTSEKK